MENLYTVNTYNYNKIQNLPCLHDTRSNKGSKKAKGYKNCMCAFDIETTRLEDIEQSIMYIWQFSILFLDDLHIDTIIGRTWTEFELFLDKLMNDDNFAYYMIFVHNLSYEFQFLRGIYTFSPDEVFAIKSRKILKCEMLERFEFRCSYLQTNMGLDSFTKKMKVEHTKLSGEIFDYSKKRYPWTPLTDYELQYSVNDTVGLLEAMYKRMILANDNLYTLPLTSTGYVRRETKKAMYGWARKHRDIFPTIDVFDLLEEAFRGGDTHANRYYSGTVIRADGKKILGIGSYDRSSSYPDVVENCVFPMTRFVFIGSITENDIEKKLDRGKALLFRCKITGLEQIDKYYGASGQRMRRVAARAKAVVLNQDELDDDALIALIEDNPTYNRDPKVIARARSKVMGDEIPVSSSVTTTPSAPRSEGKKPDTGGKQVISFR